MKCPNCNIELEKGICLKCGYMENGNTIEQFKDTNQNKCLNLIMGSYYFSYRGHLITGLISTIIASLILFLELKITNALGQLGSEIMLVIFINATFYIIINRIIYMSFSDPICIEIDKCKSKKIKDTNKLVNHKCRNILYLIIHILLSIIPMILIIKNI